MSTRYTRITYSVSLAKLNEFFKDTPAAMIDIDKLALEKSIPKFDAEGKDITLDVAKTYTHLGIMNERSNRMRLEIEAARQRLQDKVNEKLRRLDARARKLKERL